MKSKRSKWQKLLKLIARVVSRVILELLESAKDDDG